MYWSACTHVFRCVWMLCATAYMWRLEDNLAPVWGRVFVLFVCGVEQAVWPMSSGYFLDSPLAPHRSTAPGFFSCESWEFELRSSHLCTVSDLYSISQPACLYFPEMRSCSAALELSLPSSQILYREWGFLVPLLLCCPGQICHMPPNYTGNVGLLVMILTSEDFVRLGTFLSVGERAAKSSYP